MASLNENAFGSDDEDDLEYLRLAALKSLKPKANTVVSMKQLDANHGRPQNMYKQHSTFGAAQTTRNHNRGFRNNGGRIGRNGINSRTRGNSNLISIQVIDENDSKESVLNVVARTTAHAEAPKLILPQDRYYKTQTPDINIKEKEGSGNKFDRYENSSDDSDSDSDEQNLKPIKRERKNSLEALIDDIDNILEGKNDYQTKTEDKKSDSGDEKIDTLIINSQTSVDSDNDEDVEIIELPKEASDTLVIDADIVQIIDENDDGNMSPTKLETNDKEAAKFIRSRSRSRSPYLAIVAKSRSRSRSVKSRSKSPYNNKVKSPYRSPRRSRSRSPIRKNRYSPLPYARPLSPLTLNTDVLNTTMAPLSPRSAAFVLQNRQILARRQRSRSPRNRDNCMRRSSSPKRMKLSPRRRTRSRSRSPRFGSVRKCSLSPRKRSNSPKFSPKRRSTSPRHYLRRSPNMNRYRNRNSNSPIVKQSIHKRLGTKNVSSYDRKAAEPITKRKRTSRSLSLSLSPSPDRNYHKRPLNETTGQVNETKRRKDSPNSSQKSEYKEEKPLDSILLARKKKFESPVQLGKNNCVIKLNTNKSKQQTDKLNEDVTDEDYEVTRESRDAEQDEIFEKESVVDGASDVEIELNPTIDDLWSDEESDNENEGRFKSKTSNKKTVPTISIRNLTEKPVTTISTRNLSDKPVPKEPSHSRVRLEDTIAYRTYSAQRTKYGNRRNRSPPVNASSKIDSLKSYNSHEKRLKDRGDASRSKMKYEPRDKKDKAIAEKSDKNKEIDEEKIESKETLVKPLQTSEDKPANRRVKIDAEPELVSPDASIENNDEPEIIIENDDDVTTNDDESVDLRAELSRRRAERLQKAGCIPGAVPTRLLKNALQEVVPKRPTSKTLKINKGGGENAADRKVLIMKSLASSPITKIEPANKASKKEGGKLPIHMRLGQSNLGETYAAEEGDERERRLKKSRTGKRKTKQVVQV